MLRKSKSSSNQAKKGSIKDLRRILRYLKPYKRSLLGVFIALVITSSTVLAMGQGIRHLVDQGLGGQNYDLLNNAIAIMAVLIIVLAVATYARFYLITKVGENVIADIRNDIYRHLISQSPSFFEKVKVGEILSRVTTDTTVLQFVIGSSLSIAMRNILLLIGGITLLIATSPKLAGVIAVMIPLIVLPIVILGKKVRALSREAQEKIAFISGHMEETLSGIRTVQSYVREEIESSKFSTKVGDAFDAAINRVKIRGFLTALVIVSSFGSVTFILWLGGRDVISGEISAGQLSSFVFYSVLVAGAFGAISQVIGDLQRAAGAAEELMSIFNTKSDITDPAFPVPLPAKKKKRRVDFNNVTFCYPSRPRMKALSDVSFSAKPGETVALVGPSGAGKSTILQLILRFYDPADGAVAIDGIEICNLELKELREQFAYVAQEPTIFSTTVFENICYGKADATEKEVIKAAKIARAYDFINELPKGFDTFVGEKGVRLSGGEKQRLAIARAALRNPKILLLDEATSALDAENEKLVQDALDKLMKNRTTIVIAHRLSTVINADRIIVINEGKVEAEGNHKTLIKNNELYKKLHYNHSNNLKER